ncbi:MAG: hypothetical protein AMXMBFR53_39950 [Gemmatimonadota bacterium]
MTLPRLLGRLAPVVLLAACRAGPQPTVASPVQEQMFTHFALARDLRAFVVNGDLERLRVTAEELAAEEPAWGMPPGSDAHRERVHDAARSAEEAADAPEAAVAVARVAAACGACHLANDVGLGERFQVAAPLMSDPAVRHTNYLSWVSRLLWDGLVGPSEGMWRTGAGALAGGDGVPAPRGTYVPADEVARSAARLRALGADAAVAVEPEDRVRILGEVWAACAECHVQAGVR